MISLSMLVRFVFVSTLLVILTMGYIAWQQFAALNQQNQWVTHTYRVIETGEKTFSFLKDIQIGQRGYLLGGNPSFLIIYYQGMDSLSEQLQQLDRLTQDNAHQQQQLAGLKKQIEVLLAEIRQSVRYKQQADQEQVQAYIKSQQSKPRMDRIRQLINTLLYEERHLLEQRQAQQELHSRKMKGTLAVMIGLFVVLGTIAYWQSGRRIRQKALYETQLHTLNQELATANEELMASSEEIAALNEEITAANEELLTNNESLSLSNNALNRLRRELEIKVQNRTRELNVTLEQLKERNHELDNYVYKVSHDLRAPLASILGLLELIRMEEPPLRIGEYLQMVHNRVHKADQFVQSVLMHSKSLNLEIKPQLVDFEHMIGECYRELMYMRDASRLHIYTTIRGGHIFCSDVLFVSAILKNFLSNAIKYQDVHKTESYIRFTIDIQEAQAQIWVEDNGIGIEDKYQTQVFNMFFRATEKSDGSGLGLYIVRQIITRLGGELHMHSYLGQGTQFVITLPNLSEAWV